MARFGCVSSKLKSLAWQMSEGKVGLEAVREMYELRNSAWQACKGDT